MSTRRVKPGALMVAAFVVFTIVLRAYTATLVVDPSGSTPFVTIQSAIDAAIPSADDVFARCGSYLENVIMRDGVSLTGAGPGCTTIDAGHIGPAVRMPSIRKPTVLSGFTIRNGEYDALSAGAGIDVVGGSPEIRGNIIEANGLSTTGSGILVGHDSTILNAPVITQNVIRGNWNCCVGGGILLDSPDGAVITSNVIEGNSSGYGAGLYIYGGQATVANNTIIGNVSHALGGGIATNGSVTIAGNVIASNRSFGGGAVFSPMGALTFENNDAYQNVPDDYLLPGSDPTGTNGNISADPRFVDTDSSTLAGYEPRSDSPLVDRGAAAWGPARDLLGLVRPIDGDADGIARVDIGARENAGLTNLRAVGLELVWDRGNHQPETYNVYRGDLTALRDTGVYTQDPGSVTGAAHFCDFASNQLIDSSGPVPGQAFFYLVAARGVVEGTIGFDGNLIERTKSLSCHSTP